MQKQLNSDNKHNLKIPSTSKINNTKHIAQFTYFFLINQQDALIIQIYSVK